MDIKFLRLSSLAVIASLSLTGCSSGKLSVEEKKKNYESCKSQFFEQFPTPTEAKKDYTNQAEENCASLLTAEQNEVDSFIGPSPWVCEEGNDGLGKTFKCSSWSQDPNSKFWFYFTLMCFSDKSASNGIMGLDSDARNIYWKVSDKTTAKIRIDSNAAEEWKYFVDGFDGRALERGGDFLYFYKEEGTPLRAATGPEIGKMQRSATKVLLRALEGAKTFGFQAFDVEERMTSAVFNVDNQLFPISKFRELGCLD